MIHVGASPGTIDKARTVILKILKTKNTDATKIQALLTLMNVCQVKDTMITNSTFIAEALPAATLSLKKKKKKRKKP